MKEKTNWQIEVLVDLAIAALNGWESEFELLVISATKLAYAICPVKQEPQLVIKKLLVKEMGQYENYRIVFGMPRNSKRHGVNEVGRLYYPTPKEALLAAIKTKEVFVANDVLENPDTLYMKEHAQNKGIQHIAVIPIPYDNEDMIVEWLIILDRVGCSEKFNDEEKKLLEMGARIISAAISGRRNQKRQCKLDVSRDKRLLVDSMTDLLRNPLSTLSIASGRLAKLLARDDYKGALAFAKIAHDDAIRVVRDLELLKDYSEYLQDNSHTQKVEKKISDCLRVFQPPKFTVEISRNDRDPAIAVFEKLGNALFERIFKYMVANEGSGELRIRVEQDEDTNEVVLYFFCSGFLEFKIGIDFNLQLILELVDIHGGNYEMQKGCLKLSFLAH